MASKSGKKTLAKTTGASAAAVDYSNPDNAIFVNKSGQTCVNIAAKPGAKDTEIVDVQADAVNVRIGAPPIDGEANKELLRFIAKFLKLKNSDVSLDKGSKSRNKVIVLSNCDLNVEQLLEAFRKGTL